MLSTCDAARDASDVRVRRVDAAVDHGDPDTFAGVFS